MPRSGQPKHKISRRFGIDIYGTGGESLQRRLAQGAARPPAGAGRGRRRRVSEFGLQLEEKQKARAIYGLDEKQFRRMFDRAAKETGPTGSNLLRLLERRLDNVVYTLGFARSRPMARQLVSHGHVSVDGRRVDIPSFLVDAGQTVALDDKAARIPDVMQELETSRPLPAWLERNGTTGRVLALPVREDIQVPVDEAQIVAYYAR
jgi:small subunit ribosomal protein S4